MPWRHLPNAITVLRILLVLPMAWLILDTHYGAALLLAAVAGASDALDGWLARRFGWRSRLGGLLDPLADKALLTVAFITLAIVGALPAWLAILVIGRDLVIVGGALAYHVLIGPFEATPSRLSKWTTLIQIACVLVVLVREAAPFDAAAASVPGLLVGPLVALVAVFTVASGFHYIVAWSWRARQALGGRRP